MLTGFFYDIKLE